MTEPEAFPVSVYFDGKEQLERVRQLLTSVDAAHVHIYEGMADGRATAATLEEMKAFGLQAVIAGVPRAEPVAVETSEQLIRPSRQFHPVYREQISQLKRLAGTSTDPQQQIFKMVLKEPLRGDWQAVLDGLGDLILVVSPTVLQYRLNPDSARRVRQLPFVCILKPAGIGDTLTTDLLDALRAAQAASDVPGDEASPEPELASARASSDLKTFELILQGDSQPDRSAVEQILASAGAGIMLRSDSTIRFCAPLDPTLLARLGAQAAVKTISLYHEPSLACDRARFLVGISGLPVPAALPAGWNGSGETVAVIDTGIDDTHPDLVDRVVFKTCVAGANVKDRDGHGTHVAGIIAGTGKASQSAVMGVAAGANLSIVGIQDKENSKHFLVDQFLDLGPLLEMAKDGTGQIPKIINLSWKKGIASAYDFGSASIDQFVWNHEDVLVVVAAGNDGREGPDGELAFHTVGTPATAKNVLTVGASATDRVEDIFNGAKRDFRKTWAEWRPTMFSSPRILDRLIAGDPDLPSAMNGRGPSDLDSIKPDLLAPGTLTLSARASAVGDGEFELSCDRFGGNYVFLGGSSMAAPVVAGAAAILRQYLREDRQMTNPSAALMKAILVSAAVPVPSTMSAAAANLIGYPDFDQGFGRLDLSRVFPTPAKVPGWRLSLIDVRNGSNEALETRAPVGGPHRAARYYRATVGGDGSSELCIVLAWTDFAGDGIQNKLELDVRGPVGNFVGNMEHTFKKDAITDTKNDNMQVYDTRNNVQLVRIANAKPGEYRIRIYALNTAHPPQGYAISIHGNLEEDIHPMV